MLVVLALRSSDSGNQAVPPARISFDLPSFPIGSTAAVDTEWALSGKDGKDFSSTSTFVNNTSAPARVEFQEVIPKSIAADVSDITFVGPQPTVIKADPVVQYIVDIPANGEVTRTYEVEVEPLGAERSRLVEWARDLTNGSVQREGTAGAAVDHDDGRHAAAAAAARDRAAAVEPRDDDDPPAGDADGADRAAADGPAADGAAADGAAADGPAADGPAADAAAADAAAADAAAADDASEHDRSVTPSRS